MILAVYVGRIDAGLLEGCVNSLLNLLLLGLLDCHLKFVVKNLLGAVLSADGYRVH